MIEIFQKEIPWKEAMYLVSKPLQKNKYISSQYIEQAIRNVEEFGDYIVVSKGVALAHASKDSGVFKDGMSLLISKEALKWQMHRKSSFVILLCLYGRKRILSAIKNDYDVRKDSGKSRRNFKTR